MGSGLRNPKFLLGCPDESKVSSPLYNCFEKERSNYPFKLEPYHLQIPSNRQREKKDLFLKNKRSIL